MNYKLKRILFPIVSFVALVALACTCGSPGVTPTDVPLPTDAPPTKPPVTLPTKPPATKPPIGGNNGGGGIEVSADIYTHSSGAFSTALPVAWTLEERSDGIYLTEDGGSSAMDMSFTQVGVELTADALTNYINNIEFNWFGGFADYVEQAREPQDDGSLLVLKSLTTSDGTSYDVFSYYWQVGTVVYEQDFWATTDQYDAYVDGFVEIANSADTNPDAASSSPLYEFRYTFTCPQDLCTFSVPYGWSYGHDETSYEFVINDKFTAPDGTSYIDNTLYDDGKEMTKSDSGALARFLLKQFYAEDIVITDDAVQGDGSERLTWYSSNGGYSGQSFFETRGTSFLMLTWVVNDAYFDLYSPIWGDLLGTYEVP